jgi:hypothetical protein
MISVGCGCTCRQVPNVTWIVKRRVTDGYWQLITKSGDGVNCIGRVAGESDLQVVRTAPVYAVGATAMHEGLTCTVVRDDGDFVVLDVPMHSAALRGEGTLRIVPGIIGVSKSDLVLAELS